MTLEMRTTCEKCGQGLRPDGAAVIYSYECSFCIGCASAFVGKCPNCGGEPVARPKRVT
jgi:hypothetical protein